MNLCLLLHLLVVPPSPPTTTENMWPEEHLQDKSIIKFSVLKAMRRNKDKGFSDVLYLAVNNKRDIEDISALMFSCRRAQEMLSTLCPPMERFLKELFVKATWILQGEELWPSWPFSVSVYESQKDVISYHRDD
ncbi:uncharacterized protein LOC125212931 isoform X2 [Salvia hispanica]|uniref:uncharacterized protein LOC125212931 isoform X2 n=1 Tax=Salvia hispanica TaxID=49212 RepID=UPI002009775F|nr:uncharacterized protein LOC125212931 isoform X2 [Salvia hispanica]XP_047969195.1 uncharacterized protein LOC125212931 isoform X2 [Salvia hispanica]XP_047969196.1 uncharacterized protein LOC125212931 isoform X2 [Salvia hispanica]XP_047969197.1 uncharacterized protein LOC125212931 isoform X2 [Salvia hispanica]